MDGGDLRRRNDGRWRLEGLSCVEVSEGLGCGSRGMRSRHVGSCDTRRYLCSIMSFKGLFGPIYLSTCLCPNLFILFFFFFEPLPQIFDNSY